MNFNNLLQIAQDNKQNKPNTKGFSTAITPAKKPPRSNVPSDAVKKFLEKRDQLERQKEVEAKRQRERLLALRAQNAKSNKAAKLMSSRTKDNDFSRIRLTEDEVESKKKMEASIQRQMLTDKVERMKARIKIQAEQEALPHKRKRKSKVGQPLEDDKSPEPERLVESRNLIPEKRMKLDGNWTSVKPKQDPNKKLRPSSKASKAPLSFNELLKIAAEKAKNPLAVSDPEESEYSDYEGENDERLMTKKERLKFIEEQEHFNRGNMTKRPNGQNSTTKQVSSRSNDRPSQSQQDRNRQVVNGNRTSSNSKPTMSNSRNTQSMSNQNGNVSRASNSMQNGSRASNSMQNGSRASNSMQNGSRPPLTNNSARPPLTNNSSKPQVNNSRPMQNGSRPSSMNSSRPSSTSNGRGINPSSSRPLHSNSASSRPSTSNSTNRSSQQSSRPSQDENPRNNIRPQSTTGNNSSRGNITSRSNQGPQQSRGQSTNRTDSSKPLPSYNTASSKQSQQRPNSLGSQRSANPLVSSKSNGSLACNRSSASSSLNSSNRPSSNQSSRRPNEPQNGSRNDYVPSYNTASSKKVVKQPPSRLKNVDVNIFDEENSSNGPTQKTSNPFGNTLKTNSSSKAVIRAPDSRQISSANDNGTMNRPSLSNPQRGREETRRMQQPPQRRRPSPSTLSQRAGYPPMRHDPYLPGRSLARNPYRKLPPITTSRSVRRIESDDDEDEDDEEMREFIDDDPIGDMEDYSRQIQEIFGYDKNKYLFEEEFDDLEMESSYAQQMKEEMNSARLGLLEDLEDIKKEQEELKRKQLKKKAKIK